MIEALLQAQAIIRLTAVEVRRLRAPEAHQGVAADVRSVFAVANSTVARYDKATGRRLAVWNGDPARFPHVNSCVRRRRALVCAASNYPRVPMTSQVLSFDAETLRLERVRDLPSGYGSLTWLDWRRGSWWAGYANYDGKGGEPGRDHRATALVRYTPDFAPRETWRFPDRVLARFAPRSSSGGAWGPDGLLYVTGHDRPELYVLRVPKAGGVLEHVATVTTPTGGQAIGWDGGDRRLLWSIERKTSELVASKVPDTR
ncbi:hypothetical protein [uncultured Sphingomonas sp.]|uniref:hypothetical protein n=1 Tax=uncultured Sphingomonas sp. TaxID=158754 RepID=UPI0035CC64F8